MSGMTDHSYGRSDATSFACAPLVRFRTYHCGPKNTVASLRFAPPELGGGFNVRDGLVVNSRELWHAIKEETMRLSFALPLALFSVTSAIAHAQDQTVSVGSWTIATSSKADKFDGCTMSRSTNDLDITFLRTRDGLLLLLDSSKWKLERGKTYDVTLLAGSRSVQTKALAETKSVTLTLADRALNVRMRTANILEVRGEGATLRVPLDGSTAALGRLETCFEKNSRAGVESNPFVAANRKP
jgi:hypothetical protein